jgi:hypothetical protein
MSYLLQQCRRHPLARFYLDCPSCKQELHDTQYGGRTEVVTRPVSYDKRISVVRGIATMNHINIFWELEGDVWVAYRTMPGFNQRAELPDLNTEDLLQIMKYMRDFLAGTMDMALLTPAS